MAVGKGFGATDAKTAGGVEDHALGGVALADGTSYGIDDFLGGGAAGAEQRTIAGYARGGT